MTRRAQNRVPADTFGVGIVGGKSSTNLGTLWRSAYQLGAAFVFTVGRRYKRQASDTYHTSRHVPLWAFTGEADFAVPHGHVLVGVELTDDAVPLPMFTHPRQAAYLLGSEDNGLPGWALERCVHVVQIPSVRRPSYNVAVAGSIVMYDRLAKRANDNAEETR